MKEAEFVELTFREDYYLIVNRQGKMQLFEIRSMDKKPLTLEILTEQRNTSHHISK